MILAGVLRGRLRLARNLLWPRAGRRPARPRVLIGMVLAAAFAVFVFGSVAALFVELDAIGLGLAQAGAALALVFAAAAAGLLVFDLHYAVSALLLDSDLELLRRAPLPPGSLLLLKLADSLPRTSGLVAVLALPAALAFSLSHPLPAWAWLLLPLQLAALWAVPLGAGLCGALLLVRLVPARRAREALALLSTLFVVLLWLANSFLMPRMAGSDGEIAERLAAALDPAPWMIALSPPHWAGVAIAAAAAGDAVEALRRTLALVLAGAVSLGLAASAARAWLDEALARVTVDAGMKRRPRPRARPASGLAALLVKDARLFVRDWTVLGDVITAALLWTLLPLVAAPLHQAPAPQLARAMLIALAVGLGYEVGARAVPFERAALPWCGVAPVPPLRWNLAKLAGGAALSLPLLAIAAAAVRAALPLGWMEWEEALTAALSALVMALTLGLWTGWAFGDPRWTNPRAMLTLTGRVVASALLIAQAAMWLVMLALADHFRAALPPGIHSWGPPLLAAGLVAPLLQLAERRMRRYEWVG